MSMHKSGRNDTTTPGASIGQEYTNCKTLGDYVTMKEKQLRKEHEASLTEYQKGYQDGWHDAHVKIKAGE